MYQAATAQAGVAWQSGRKERCMNSFDQWGKRLHDDMPHRANELMRLQQLDAANRAQLHQLEQAEADKQAMAEQQPTPRKRPWWRFW
jgi:transcription initiation factor IIF auxiliary subunit